MIRSPTKLPPVAFSSIEPCLERLGAVQKAPHADEKPAVDGLAVTAPLTGTRGTTEVYRRGVGSIRIEARQYWVTVP